MPASRRFKTKEDYNAWFRAYRAANREKFREYNREYNSRWRRENGYHNEKASQEKYPEKQRARYLLQRSVKAGATTKGACEVCNSDKSEAHHDDYSKPLDVRWLCRIHHTEVHRPYVPAPWSLQPALTRKRRIRVKGRSVETTVRVRLSPCSFCGSKRLPFKPHIKCLEARERIKMNRTIQSKENT